MSLESKILCGVGYLFIGFLVEWAIDPDDKNDEEMGKVFYLFIWPITLLGYTVLIAWRHRKKVSDFFRYFREKVLWVIHETDSTEL